MKYQEQNKLRLFVAVELPDMVKAELGSLAIASPDVRWLQSQQYHITLNFIGDASTAETNQVIDILKKTALQHDPFQIKLSGISVEHGKMIWVSVLDPSGSLNRFHQNIKAALVAAKIGQMEERRYRPHVLLAKYGAGQLRSESDPVIEHAKANFKITPHEVNEIVLFESRLRPSGAEHLPLKKIALAKQTQNEPR